MVRKGRDVGRAGEEELDGSELKARGEERQVCLEVYKEAKGR